MDWPQEFLKVIFKARSCVVLTGAGISAESGLATFRGRNGWWRNYDPMRLATPQAFEEDPRLVWEWYQWRRQRALEARPNPGHLAIAELEKHFPEFLLITQNVDGLHQRAGSLKLVELHGNIHRNRCFCCRRLYESIPNDTNIPPRCICGGLFRPDVVWFGEELSQDAWRLAWKMAGRAEIFFIVGTSGLVQPAATLPLVAKQNNAYVVEVNPEATPLSSCVDMTIRAKAGDAMMSLVGAMKMQRKGAG